MKTLSPLLLLALLGTTALTSAPARADDSRIYPGVMCAPNTDHTDVATYWGRLKNSSTSTRYFDCPVVRDNLSDPVVTGDVWVINQNYDVDLSCTLGMLLPLSGGTNSVSGYFSTRSTGVVSSAPQKLPAFGSLGHLGDGYVLLSCAVPPLYSGKQSGVVSYRIQEDSP